MCAHGKPPLVTTDREPLGLYRDAQTTDALRGLRFRLVGDSTMMELAMALSHVGVACDRIEWHALCVVDHRPSMLLRLLADALRGAPDVLVISVGMWYSWNTSSAAGAPTEGSTSTDAKHIHRRGCNAVRLAAASFSPPKTRSPPIQPPPPSTRWTARQPARTSTAASSTPRARRTPTIGVHAVPSAGHTTLTICTASSGRSATCYSTDVTVHALATRVVCTLLTVACAMCMCCRCCSTASAAEPIGRGCWSGERRLRSTTRRLTQCTHTHCLPPQHYATAHTVHTHCIFAACGLQAL
jgi:hypothetical protein